MINCSTALSGSQSATPSFVEVRQVAVVQGKYPQQLLDAWHAFDDDRGTENDDPGCLCDSQLFLVMLCNHGGVDLESYDRLTFGQACSILVQVRGMARTATSICCRLRTLANRCDSCQARRLVVQTIHALAVAELRCEFEHRGAFALVHEDGVASRQQLRRIFSCSARRPRL